MNIFHKITMESLKKSRTRTLVTIVGVILSAAMITSVATFAVSLQNYMINGAAVKYGNWHVAIPNGDSSFLSEQREDSRVESVVALKNIGYAPLEGGLNPDKPYLFVTGWSKEALKELPMKLISGRLPENSSEVLIPAHITANGGVNILVGDTLSLSVGDRIKGDQKLSQHDAYCAGEETLVSQTEKTYKVVGICQRPAIEEYAAPGYTIITTGDAVPSDSFTVFITLKNPYQVHSYIDSISDEYRHVLNDDVLRFMGLSGEKMITVLLYSIVGILIALVMLGSVFLIYNSFNISLNERMHQFGILMSVGATEKQLLNSVLFEGLCVGAVGIPLGILVGIPSIRFVLALVAKNFANAMYDTVPLALVVSIPVLIGAAVISLITILISAYIPAKKAARTPVMECIRQTNEVKVEGKAIKISKFVKRFYGLEEILALKNFKRNKRRYRSIILSLTLSVVLFVTANSFGTYLKQIGEGSAMVSENYDICFYSRDMAEGDLFQLYDEIKTVEGVTKSSYQALSTYSCVLNVSDLPRTFLNEFGDLIGYDGMSETVEVKLDVQFIENGVYENLLKGLGLSKTEYTGQDQNMIMAGILPLHWYTQQQPMEFILPSKNGEQTKNLRATFVKDYPDLLPSDPGEWSGYSLMIIAPYEVKPQFDALNNTAKPTKLGMTFQSENPGRSTAEMKKIIEGANITPFYNLYNLYEILEQNRNLSFIVNLFSVVFIAMITVIGIANVFNTISTNVKLRRRELAMIRSVGMSDKDFNKMMCFECVLYGGRTMLWGLPLSGALSYLIYKGMVIGGGNIAFIFPWKSMTISVLGVLFIVFITMLYAINKIKKENIIDALRDDMS
ncbi:ABC transporter permease [Anaerotignum propionicum]|uniref:ABC transport system permease protein n=1 Tax=Anaerotignum propionicum DSM 1682 TaxID=991789 RepID=A0A0X1U708_ANAPI|nr:ABC transporter permease [Anaerotignum propionicum]AMJ40720.1 ABC transporter permease YtrF precursor [Anaerotignum propionicum DSM 1682]SHF08092.1 putative ABC transport system permease protein [[Clostridium] propionicum DSM 1682] [Anaerotignum propionicum DSM 1682]